MIAAENFAKDIFKLIESVSKENENEKENQNGKIKG